MITIELPFPPAILFPNKPGSWKAKMGPRAKYKQDCYLSAQTHKSVAKQDINDMKENIHVRIVFHQPDKRSRDIDGMLSACKNCLDGVCLAWGIDDKRLRPITIDDGEIVKGGKVVITFGC